MNNCFLWGRLVTCGRLAIGLLLVFFTLPPAHAQDARQIVAESQKRSQSKSLQYEGTLEVLGSANKVSVKHWEFARTGSFGVSKSILRFTAPAEVKGVALLIVNHPDRASDQWMWTPGLARDRHIALQNRATGFFGTGFSFEDLEERDVNQFDYKLLGVETVDGQQCWKIESKPKESKSSQYASSVRSRTSAAAIVSCWRSRSDAICARSTSIRGTTRSNENPRSNGCVIEADNCDR